MRVMDEESSLESALEAVLGNECLPKIASLKLPWKGPVPADLSP